MDSGDTKPWRIVNVAEHHAGIAADGFGLLEVLRRPGAGEWSYEVARVEQAEEKTSRIEPLGARGSFLITGLVTSEWPSSWPDDHDDELDGPKIPSWWSMTVAGIQFEISREAAKGVTLTCGLWLRLQVSNLTLWWGQDQVVPYFRETGSRRVIQRIFDHLVRANCRSMWVGKEGESPEVWLLHIRPGDLKLAAEVSPSNL